jgi:glycosyltransferase involved in cell wall biosynthesis
MPEGTIHGTARRTQCRRFAFLGRIIRDKGVGDILEVDGQFPEEVRIDIYGPLSPEFTPTDFVGRCNVTYRGEIAPDLVPELLSNCDALLLPTRFPGEGYPGVIVEAFGAGIPVIATRWLSIPEIVDDTCGILVPPRDPDALAEAIKRLVGDSSLYSHLCTGAAAQRALFSSAHWTDVLVGYCRELATGRHGGPETDPRQMNLRKGS